jgi:hypothetical protein
MGLKMIEFALSLALAILILALGHVGPARAAQMPEQFHGEWRAYKEAPDLRSENQGYSRNCEPGPYCPEAAPEELFYSLRALRPQIPGAR